MHMIQKTRKKPLSPNINLILNLSLDLTNLSLNQTTLLYL
jgi:hypothetical protein